MQALRPAAIALLLASSLAAQNLVTIPPHASTYNGYSRGYNFTANTPFVISQVGLPLDAMQAGDTAGFLIRLNGNVALYSTGNAGPNLATNILVNQGDVVDVIGNWSPLATTNFSAHNSYGSTAPYSTTIEGVPHTLNRAGWQYDIGSAAYTTGTYLAPTTGSMGRVYIWTQAPSGFASSAPYGTGCYTNRTSFYENFGVANNDLGNSVISMLPSGGGHIVLPGASSYVPPSPAAAVLSLTDDSETTVSLSSPFPYSGGSTSTLVVCSNGFVSVATGNGVLATPSVTSLLNNPQTGWYNWHDYDPAAIGGGQVKFEQIGSIAYITWDGVWDFAGTTAASANTFQYQFDTATGAVHLAMQTMSSIGSNGFLVGFSPAGSSVDPGPRDISATLPASFTLAGSDAEGLGLAASARPVLGTSINLASSNIPAGTTLGAALLGFQQFNPGNSLGLIGMPGCFQYVSPDFPIVFVVAGSTASVPLAIPNNPLFSGLHVYAQSATFSAGQNPLGVLSSNGVDLALGAQ